MSRRTLAIVIAAVVIAIPVAATAAYVGYGALFGPTTATVTPAAGTAEVPLDRPFVIRFSRTTDGESFSTHFHLSPATEGRLVPGTPATIAAASGARTSASGGRVAGDSNAFAFVPTGQWADHTLYAVILDTYRDQSGHQVTGGRWTFTTTTVPRVIEVDGEAGTSLADAAQIPVHTKVTLVFNAAMDQTATQVSANGAVVHSEWSSDGTRALVDLSSLPVAPVELKLSDSARDTARHSALAGWAYHLSIVFRVSVHTTSLAYPALIQIPNDPGGRDQSGLQSADVVYEYATEGGITRFTAIFTKVPDKVGPVRSGRLISLRLTKHYGGMLFLSGASEGTIGRLNADPVATFFDTQGYFYRTLDHAPPDNLYINGDSVKRAEDGTALAPKGVPTGSLGAPSGTATQSFRVAEHNTQFEYDAATRTFTKTEDGHQISDAGVGQPVHIGLVVVLHTRITTTSIIEDSNGAHGLDYDMESGGRAQFLWQGTMVEGTWSSGDRQPLRFATDSGTPIPVPTGQLTWVEVVS